MTLIVGNGNTKLHSASLCAISTAISTHALSTALSTPKLKLSFPIQGKKGKQLKSSYIFLKKFFEFSFGKHL